MNLLLYKTVYLLGFLAKTRFKLEKNMTYF